jgi:hypothetical protein
MIDDLADKIQLAGISADLERKLVISEEKKKYQPRRGFNSSHAPTQITCFVDHFNKQEYLY